MRRMSAIVTGIMLASGTTMAQEPPIWSSERIASFAIPEANQGVGVDAEHFYAIDNHTIAKYAKTGGERVGLWEGGEDGPVLHLDSAVLVEGRLYAAHSNYPDWPMTSSIEVFEAGTMEHVDTHSFGIDRGSLTWLDFYDGTWWAGFANYNRVFDRSPLAYGNKYTTQVVRLDDAWRVAEAWVLPDPVLEKFEDMSNSGGSWGPDGKLYLTGHDPAEAYVMELPEAGSVLRWVATVPLDNTGQGIAWDRSTPDVLYAMVRGESDDQNRITANRVLFPAR
ncbi:cycloisomerase [Marinivivus vitaminiproducens]|uniref:cycloisomerase n=1 Tax=Marinivivus vitaminiproducens TaxID=3035935 RepID=UPI0027A8863A|nr:hypothetical protein P4R82_05580 [Geminicoccaceae bacterium SCSIO 64248]